jgi:hypothetical protein
MMVMLRRALQWPVTARLRRQPRPLGRTRTRLPADRRRRGPPSRRDLGPAEGGRGRPGSLSHESEASNLNARITECQARDSEPPGSLSARASTWPRRPQAAADPQ